MSSKNRQQQRQQNQPSDQELLQQALQDGQDQSGQKEPVDETVADDQLEGAEQKLVSTRGQTENVAIFDEAAFQNSSVGTDPAAQVTGSTEQFVQAELAKAAQDIPAIHDQLVTQPTQQLKKEEARIVKSVEMDLVTYMESVHPTKAMDPQAGADWQFSLLQTLKRVLGNKDPEVFKQQWRHLLAFFHQHADELFNENYMFRFQNHWKGSAKEFTTFRHLVFLAMTTANPQTRAEAVRSININRVVENLDAQSGTNLIAFYS